MLQPNKITTLVLNDNYITARQLQKGSRLVIVLGVNKDGDWEVNYGSGKPVAAETIEDATVPMKVKWYNNSSISFPILR